MFTIFVMGHHNTELSPVPFCYAVISRRHGTVIWRFWFSQCCCWRFRSSGMWCCLAGSVAPQVAVDYPLEHQELPAQHTALHARRLYLILACYLCCSISSNVADIMSRSRMTSHRCAGCSQQWYNGEVEHTTLFMPRTLYWNFPWIWHFMMFHSHSVSVMCCLYDKSWLAKILEINVVLQQVVHRGEKRNEYRVLLGRPEGKRPFVRPMHGWEVNIKLDLKFDPWRQF